MHEKHTPAYVQVINSTVLYLLAVLWVYALPTFLLYFFSASFGIETDFSDFKIVFITEDASPLWNRKSIVRIFSIPSIANFLLIPIFWYLAYRFRQGASLLKFLFLWIFVVATNRFFGGIIGGVIAVDGLLYVFNWLRMPSGMPLVLSILSAFILIFAGQRARLLFARNALERSHILIPKNQLRFKLRIIILPYLLANVLLLIMHFPSHTIFDNTQKLTMLLMLLPILPYFSVDHIRIVRRNTRQYVAWGFIILLVVTYSIYFYIVKF